MKVSLAFARFPYHGQEHPDVTDWLLATGQKLAKDPHIGEVYQFRLDDTPITMTRNMAVHKAQMLNADYLVMIDSDMSPDLPLRTPNCKPFWDSSFEFILNHRHRPCIIAAPYVGPPPHCNVYIFHWVNFMNDNPNPNWKLELFTRSEAEGRTGIEEVAALPTGLIIIDMRVFKQLQPPYFYYEWTNEYELEKASTEDVAFTRDVSLSGCPVYVNWDSWAGHWKAFRGDKPASPTLTNLRHKFSESILQELQADKTLGVTPTIHGASPLPCGIREIPPGAYAKTVGMDPLHRDN